MKIKSLTEYAYRHLTVEDIETLECFIGCETEFSIIENDMLIMPDGCLTHKDFLITQE